MSAEAYLYYGFLLGCPEEAGWLVKEADRYGGIENPEDREGLGWLAAAEEEGDYVDRMRNVILAEAGSDLAPSEDLSPDELLATRCGVEIVEHGSSFTGVMHYGVAMAGTVCRADDWTPKQIAPASVMGSHEPLHRALKALGMTPNQVNPSWILAPGES